MQQRVERAGTQLVTVATQFLYEPQPVNRLFRGVVKDMQPDEARVELLVFGRSRFL
jgi:hypothetical protein